MYARESAKPIPHVSHQRGIVCEKSHLALDDAGDAVAVVGVEGHPRPWQALDCADDVLSGGGCPVDPLHGDSQQDRKGREIVVDAGVPDGVKVRFLGLGRVDGWWRLDPLDGAARQLRGGLLRRRRRGPRDDEREKEEEGDALGHGPPICVRG